VDEDCLAAAQRLSSAAHRPRVGVLNMANEINTGGAFSVSMGAQEEYLFRNSSLGLSLWPHRRPDLDEKRPWAPGTKRPLYRPWAHGTKLVGRPVPAPASAPGAHPLPHLQLVCDSPSGNEQWYPWTELGGVVTPRVEVFSIHDILLDPAERFDVIGLSVAAQDLRNNLTSFDPDVLRGKIRTLLYMAMQSNCDALVLGALGCGAFQNKPEEVARAFWELLVPEEAEFYQLFATVEFAINSNINSNSQKNLAAFQRQFSRAAVSDSDSLKDVFAGPVHKRQRVESDVVVSSAQPIRFGFFTGETFFRNRLIHRDETLASGFVTLRNLVPCGCTDALATTFIGSSDAWLAEHFAAVARLLVVVHDNRELSRTVGNAELTPIDSRLETKEASWQRLWVRPQTGGLMHAKLILLRTPSGLRVVVLGNNLFDQWDRDRDALWVQDFSLSDGTESGSAASGGSEFKTRLCCFLSRLTACRDSKDSGNIQRRLAALVDGVDFSVARARLVESFATSAQSGTCGHVGHELTGWERLGEAAAAFQADLRGEEAAPVFAMAGSFGNVTPGFMSQMWQAMHGRIPRSVVTDWSHVEPIRALWPSRGTALSMNLAAVISFRAIPAKYWEALPTDAKNRYFFDAPPNPPHKQPICGGYCCTAHAKVLLKTASTHSVVYVGSHNLSKPAWGEAKEHPKNIELGVLLASCDEKLRKEWVDRLPCILPSAAATSATAADRSDYFPASAPHDIRKLAGGTTPGAADKAIDQMKAYLVSGKWPLESQPCARDAAPRQQMCFALVWPDEPNAPPLLYLEEGKSEIVGRALIIDRLAVSEHLNVSRKQAELLVKDGGVQVRAIAPYSNATGVRASRDSGFEWLWSGPGPSDAPHGATTKMLSHGALISLRANYTKVSEGCVLMVASVPVL
jgi:hypothetical protein